MKGTPTFGKLLRHLRETAGMPRDEAASIAGMDSRKYGEIEAGKSHRSWPATQEGLQGLRRLLDKLEAEYHLATLWIFRMRRRKNFHFRFGELPTDIQVRIVNWELTKKTGSGVEKTLTHFPSDADHELSESVREIVDRIPSKIPDNS